MSTIYRYTRDVSGVRLSLRVIQIKSSTLYTSSAERPQIYDLDVK